VNLFLIGCRGSGKTTIGSILAKQLGWEFVDLDAKIVEAAGSTIKEIFAAEGEEGFRRRESEACQQLKRLRRRVIALGGGSLIDAENQALVKRLGKIVWLRAPAAVLWSRVKRDPQTAHNRPNLTDGGGLAELEAILAAREPQYKAAANHTIDTVAESPREIAEAIEMWFRANEPQTH
jgi:shikimate kinase